MQNELFKNVPDMISFRRRFGRNIKTVLIALICLQILYYLYQPLPSELSNLNAQGGLTSNFSIDRFRKPVPPISPTSFLHYHSCLTDTKYESPGDEIYARQQCEAKDCIWNPFNSFKSGGMWYFNKCYFPEGRFGYRVSEMQTENSMTTWKLRVLNQPLVDKNQHPMIKVQTNHNSQNQGRIIIQSESKQSDEWHVPFDHPEPLNVRDPKFHFEESQTDAGFGLTVTSDKAGRCPILRTDKGPIIYEDQFKQISFSISSLTTEKKKVFYGLGEMDKTSFGMTTWNNYMNPHNNKHVIWASGQPNHEWRNSYGQHPFFMFQQGASDGCSSKWIGAFLLNSNAIELEFYSRFQNSEAEDLVIIRTIGGVLDFYLIVEDSFSDVVKQYHSLIGKTFMPPYWAYGYQLSAWGYDSLQTVENIVEENTRLGVPIESQYIDIDYMERAMGFTIGKDFEGLGEFSEELNAKNMKLILIFDPTICTMPYVETEQIYDPLTSGYANEVFIKQNDEIVLGIAYAGIENSSYIGDFTEGWQPKTCPSAFIDFFKESTGDWWTQQLTDFHKKVKFSAIWIDKNEPKNYLNGAPDGCGENRFENPPYISSNLNCYAKNDLPTLKYESSNHMKLARTYAWFEETDYDDLDQDNPEEINGRCIANEIQHGTLCMTAEMEVNGKKEWHYNAHGLYGNAMTQTTFNAMQSIYPEKRSWLITRSTFPGAGRHGGHWTGDNLSTWQELKNSIPAVLENNMFGIPFTGADVCGFNENADEDLCTTWTLLGITYPLMRNHNARNKTEQDPASWSLRHSEIIIPAIHLRYSLLPELHNQFWQSHNNGGNVVKSMVEMGFEIEGAENQLFWGDSIMFAPQLEFGWMRNHFAYVHCPVDMYDITTGIKCPARSVAQKIVMETPRIPVFLLSGNIIFRQMETKMTITETRKSPFRIEIASKENERISKSLYWDNDDNNDYKTNHFMLDVSFDPSTFGIKMSAKQQGISFEAPDVDEIVIYLADPEKCPEYYRVSFGTGLAKTSGVLKVVKDKRNKCLISGIRQAIKYNWKSNLDLTAYEGEYDSRIDCSSDGKCPDLCIQDTTDDPMIALINAPTCYHDPEKRYYTFTPWTDGSSDTLKIWHGENMTDNTTKFYYQPLQKITYSTKIINNDIVRVKVNELFGERYEVPIELHESTSNENPYKIKILDDGRITSGDVTVWDPTVGPIIFEDRFLQISSKLNSRYVYGIGETEHLDFRLDRNWYQQGIFSYDNYIDILSGETNEGVNQWGVHPFFINVYDGRAHGIFFLNSNAMDITISNDIATWRSTGGIMDFYIFTGPSPAAVVRQYQSLIGRSMMVPYWSLGFQICRYDYPNLDNMMEVVEGVREYGIPYDVQYGDIDYMERQLDFTVDPIRYKGLVDYVKKIQNDYDMNFVVILDPPISANESSLDIGMPKPEAEHCYEVPTSPYSAWDSGLEMDIFIKKPEGSYKPGDHPYDFGRQWPYLPGCRSEKFICPEDFEKDGKCMDFYTDTYHAHAAYPDFFHPNASNWWTNEISKFHNDLIPFNGLWIDMNEPSSFSAGFKQSCDDTPGGLNQPLFWPNVVDKLTLSSKTLCMESLQTYYKGNMQTTTEFYNTHSLFGYSQSKPTRDACEAATGKRCMIISRSTYPGSNQYVQHWHGDNYSKWDHIKLSIISMLEFSLFGFSYTGSDICGHVGNATYDLCLRWSMVGAFYPFSRNHNANYNRRQDPAAWDEYFAFAVRDIYLERYRLLPYLYTLIHDAHTTGETVVRPLMLEFPNDHQTYEIDEQFLWGRSFLISPALTASNFVHAYFPSDSGMSVWYNYFTGEAVENEFEILYTELDEINLHVRSGSALPLQEPDVVTKRSRVKPFGLLYALPTEGALDSTTNNDEIFVGSMFWDDGDQIELKNFVKINFFGSKEQVRSEVIIEGTYFGDLPPMNNLTIFGLDEIPSYLVLEAQDKFPEQIDFETEQIGKHFVLRAFNMAIQLNKSFTLIWY